MRKRIAGIFLAVLLLFAVTGKAQGWQETDWMLRAFERAQLYAQGFEVRYAVEKTPAQAVPLLGKASALAASLPQGTFETQETKETTQLIMTCRVAPQRGAVQGALSQMRRTLGLQGEVTLTLYGLAPGLAASQAAQEETLRALMETLGDSVRSTRRGEDGVALLGRAYQAAAKEDAGRVRIAIARPRFAVNQESGRT